MAFIQSTHMVLWQRTCSSFRTAAARGSFSATVFSFFNTKTQYFTGSDDEFCHSSRRRSRGPEKKASKASVTRYSTGSGDEFGHSSKRRSRGPTKKASKGENVEEGKYKHTVDLPNTKFGMRANALAGEHELQKLWDGNEVIKRVVSKNDGGSYVLHDHAFNKNLKGIINRYKLLQNYKFHYVPGWDCHGLPIGWDFASQIEEFGKMASEGYIYRGLKPVNWSPSLRTALAEAELEDTIWQQEKLFLIVASDLVPTLETKWGTKLILKKTLPGSELENCRYIHPIDSRECPVVCGDYVTTDSGTGLVHTAPAHGPEDYATGLKYGLPMLSFVDEGGNFIEEATRFSGLSVLGDGNIAVMKYLDEQMATIMEEPYDEQWFASVEGFCQATMDEFGGVKWIPLQAENRICAMTSSRSDWCISRQRTWGVPIPVFYHVNSKEPLMNKETIDHVNCTWRAGGLLAVSRAKSFSGQRSFSASSGGNDDGGEGAPSIYSDVCENADVSAFKLTADWTKLISFTVRHQGFMNFCWAFDIATLFEYINKIYNPDKPQIVFSAMRIAECMAACKKWLRMKSDGYDYNILKALSWLSGRGLVSIRDGPDTTAFAASPRYTRSRYVQRYLRHYTVRLLDLNDQAEMTKILLDRPILAGIWVDASFRNLKPGMVYRGPVNTHKPEKHTIVIIASEKYEGEEVFIFQNSYGVNWADGGFGRVLRKKTLYLTGLDPDLPDDCVFLRPLLIVAVTIFL